MLVNVLPTGVKRKLNRLFSRFMWGRGSESKNKLHQVKLDTVTSFVSEGGLGVMDLNDMNIALAAK